MQKYYIYCRYEFFSNEGKQFCNWFKASGAFDTEDLAKEGIKKIKETSKEIDKHTKLKHEYEVRYLDETLIPQIRMRRPKGRPRIIDNNELDKYIKTLNKYGQVKIDDNIKEYLYNDEESKKYIQDHIKEKDTKWVRYWYDNDNVLYLILKDNSEKIYG